MSEAAGPSDPAGPLGEPPHPEPAPPAPADPATDDVAPPAGPGAADPATPAASADPDSLDLTGLPPLEFPNREAYQQATQADARRAGRLRVEAIGGGVLLVVGLLAAVFARAPKVAGLALLAVAALAAYEFLVRSFE